MAALAGHALEQRQRAIVLGGLFPLLDALVRAELGPLLRCSRLDGAALGSLQLARRVLTFGGELVGWAPTLHAPDVHQQLAVLRYEGLRAPPPAAGAWREVLLCGSRWSERGGQLLEWLRVATPQARCFDCDAQATGLAARHLHPERGWVLACTWHRTPAWEWRARAVDLGLEPVPSHELGEVHDG